MDYTNVVIDIGGSGTRLGVATPTGVISVRSENIGSISDLAYTIRSLLNGGVPNEVALAIPGIIEGDNVILSQNADWLTGDTAIMIADSLKLDSQKVYIVNDGEAHARALRRHPNIKFGAINFAFGTGVAFGVLDVKGNVLRSLSGDNWELGDFELNTRSVEKSLWYALGSCGLEDLLNWDSEKGANHYGHRLGHFVAQMSLLFRPKTVELSGGIIKYNWEKIELGFNKEFMELQKYCNIFPIPTVIVSADDNTALAGLSTLFYTSARRHLPQV